MYRIFYCLVLLCWSSQSYAGETRNNALDPTKPLFGVANATGLGAVPAEKSLVLEAIIHGTEIHTAIINGKALKVNDRIGEYRLVAVNDKSVVLLSTQERLKLNVFSKNIITDKK
mgnify:CR=1 FL=1